MLSESRADNSAKLSSTSEIMVLSCIIGKTRNDEIRNQANTKSRIELVGDKQDEDSGINTYPKYAMTDLSKR